MKSADRESRLVELLKAHTWNDAVRILKEEKRELREQAKGLNA